MSMNMGASSRKGRKQLQLTANDLKERVEIREPKRVKGAGAGFNTTYEMLYTLWANVTHNGATEVIREGRTVQLAQLVVKVRYSPERSINNAMRVGYRGSELLIKSVVWDRSLTWVTIACEEVK